MDRHQPDGGFDWAQRFDDAARALMTERPHDVPSLASHRDYKLAVPTDEHFLPLLYVAGLASAAGKTTDVLVDGYALGSLSMTAYTLQAHCPEATGDGGGAAPIDTTLPPEDANV